MAKRIRRGKAFSKRRKQHCAKKWKLSLRELHSEKMRKLRKFNDCVGR